MKALYLIAALMLSLNSFGAPPTVPASNLSVNVIEGNYFNVGWTAGNGTRRIMIVRAGQAVTAVPQNGVDYTENTNFGSGQAILPGQYVVYDNAFTSFFLTGLAPATQYFFAIFEYNGTGASIEYGTTSFLTGNATTVSAPTAPASAISFSNITATSVLLSWVSGNGTRRLVLAREASAVNTDPVNLQAYSGNSAFGSGAQLGTGNYSVYSSTGNAVNITNLKAGTQYFFAVYEYNGNNAPVYLLPGITANVTTRTIPTIASSAVAIVKTDGKELNLNWTSGNGQRRIIVAKQGAAPTALPANGSDYTANDIFGNGAALAAGEFVVYSGTGNSAIIQGLTAATSYYFRIYEYDGTGANTLFLTSTFGSVNGSTAAAPTVQASGIAASNVLGTSLSLTWLGGDGRARLVIARKDAPVNVSSQDFTLYTANSDFGAGQQLGTGNYVLANTTDLFLNVHNLEPNTTYHFAVFEYNGFNQPVFLLPPAIFSVTTAGVVPVKLSGFTAVAADGKIRLSWETQSEINASHFNIQRSTDGTHFTFSGKVPARGNSQVPIQYINDDLSAPGGNVFYRLEMVDIDGRVEYSTVIKVSNRQEVGRIQIWDQSPGKQLVVKMPSQPDRNATQWRIISAGGQIYKTGTITANNVEIDIQQLAPGMYWFQVMTKGKPESAAFVKR